MTITSVSESRPLIPLGTWLRERRLSAEAPFGMLEPPSGKNTLAGSGGHGPGRKQPFVEANEAIIAGHFTCSYPSALREVCNFARLTGISIGTSAAANWLAAKHVALRLGPGATVVTVFPSLITSEEWENIGRLEELFGADLGGMDLETKLDGMNKIGERLNQRRQTNHIVS
jgi:hypothetical protein